MSNENNHSEVLQKIIGLYSELFQHDGFGNMSIEMKFLKKGQKEVLIRCGKDYRFVIDYTGCNSDLPKALKNACCEKTATPGSDAG